MRVLLFSLVLLVGCAAATQVVSPAPPAEGSCLKPVPINAKTEQEGIAAEHAWLEQHYPGARFTGDQALMTCQDRPADRLVIVDGFRNVAIYFDISSFFGR